MALRIDAPKKPPKKVSVERNQQGFITGQTIEEDESARPSRRWSQASSRSGT